MKSILSFLWQVHHGEVCRFCRSVRGTVASFSNQDLTNKSWEVHLYCTLMACGDCGRTTQKGFIEILEFTHFVEFFSFNRITENHKEKELVRKVTVVVALDLGCGNTKNSEYESE